MTTLSPVSLAQRLLRRPPEPETPAAENPEVAAAAPTAGASHERRRREAQRSRQRFYPSTALYTFYCTGLIVYALFGPHPWLALFCYAAGVAAWTLLEYFAHRYVLHGRFEDGSSLHQRLAHKFFDPLHWEHHARPWDGNHISGSLRDTIPFSLLFVLAAALTPAHTLPAFVAGLLQAYVAEEWVHHSVHYYDFKNPYLRYIKRHHLYHHSPKGSDVAFGLTSGFWDVIFRTRIPAEERLALYRRQG